MGTKIPARCSKCKKLGYISNVVEIDGPANRVAQYAAAGKIAGAMFIDCTFISTCECGGDMVSLEGDYVMNSDKASLLSGPQSSWEALQELAAVVKASIEAGESPEKTVERAVEILPSLGKYKQYLANAVVTGLTWLVMEVASIKLAQELTPTPVTQEQTAALIERSETRILDAIAASQHRSEPKSERLGLRPYGNPMFENYPITAQKLADYEKQRRKID